MKLTWVLAAFLFTSLVDAQQIPVCDNNKGQVLNINNQDVLNWKNTTKNQYHDRGHIKGTISQIYADHSGHHHIEALIGPDSKDTIEVIYNEDFGPLPANARTGSQIEACGDYITANQESNGYPASPDGAIVHWVHRSPNPNHPSGFMVIDGTLCGWAH